MGCGGGQKEANGGGQTATRRNSSTRTPFDTNPEESLHEVAYKARNQGPRMVRVTGRVMHTGSVIEAPFSSERCVMVNVLFYMSESRKAIKGWTPKKHLVCAGSNSLGFKIVGMVDGRMTEIHVEPGQWDMHFERTHVQTDIRWDKKKDLIVCQSAKSRKRLQLAKAKDFWDRFVKEVGPSKVELPDSKDRSWKGSLDVHEFSLHAGETVAMLGRIKAVGNKVVFEARAGLGLSMITNKPSMAASLNQPPDFALDQGKPEVVDYNQATE